MDRSPVVRVAMSGGVDSSLAAALLREQGHAVEGITLEFGTGPEACGGSAAVRDARRVAAQLGIPHRVVAVGSDFERSVLAPAWREYIGGRTPNPCVHCNRLLKLPALLAGGGEARVATGHYVRRGTAPDGTAALYRGVDGGKDQSYFLFALTARQRRRLVTPLGALTKAQVRREAAERGLVSADRAESQDACFASRGRTFPEALRAWAEEAGGEPPVEPVEIRDEAGRRLGTGPGVYRYTVGQRRGLGLALGRPAWVLRVEPGGAAAGRPGQPGSIVITTDPERIRARHFEADGLCWHPAEPPDPEREVQVQIRYRNAPVAGRIHPLGEGAVRVVLTQPVRAVTPGQAAVFYAGDRLLGGAWIRRSVQGAAAPAGATRSSTRTPR